jgi:hypothetical protein
MVSQGENGFAHLQRCNAGRNSSLLIEFAKTFNVSVYAGTGAHNPLYRFNCDDYVGANWDGSFDTKVGRP